ASAAIMAVAIGGLAWLYVTGRMSLAATGAAVFGLYQLSSRLRTMHFSAATLYESTLFVRDYSSFLKLQQAGQNDGGLPAPAGIREIAVEHVTFGYPDTKQPALDDVSLVIGSGEIVALVGENGSGKTTLAKLIAGLYPPDRGRILWNGVDAAAIDADQLRRL